MGMTARPLNSAPLTLPALLTTLTSALQAAGGRPVVVGGAVRDHMLHKTPKDFDVEVYGLSLDDVEAACARVGKVHAVGRSFGVLKVTLADVIDGTDVTDTYDVALPRTENKVGQGHRGFVVESQPDLTFADAATRRDFTLNAMGWDVVDNVLLDPHGGQADLADGVLRHVSDAFDEDPLRVLRGCQFAARFDLVMHDDTVAKCRSLQSELSTLPKERLWEEWKKLLLQAERPSVGLDVMRATGALVLFPELEAMIGCEQDVLWHPEGDVWVHTLMVVDEAARICREAGVDDDERLLAMYGALLHDVGKPDTTQFEDGHIRSRGHEAHGEVGTRSFMERIGAPHDVTDAVVPLVKEHLKPHALYGERDRVSDGALRRLALRVPIERLVLVSHADFCGRTTKEALSRNDPSKAWLLEQAERLQVQRDAPQPLLQGRHLLALGMTPGPAMGDILKAAFAAQLDGAFHDVDGGEAWLQAHLAEREKA